MKPRICIIGHARHGKDTVAEIIHKHTGLTFLSSSMASAQIFIYDLLKAKYGYQTFEECFQDRMNHRKEWHDLICEFNKDDPSRLARHIMAISDIYVGMRSNLEIQECKQHKTFNLVIGVFDPSKPLEPNDSFDIDIWKESDFIMIAQKDMKKLEYNVMRLCNGIIHYVK